MFTLLLFSLTRGKTAPADPTVSDADKYTLVLQNEQVRVLRYHDEPGDKTHMHSHPAFVLYVVGPFLRRLTFPDGTTKE